MGASWPTSAAIADRFPSFRHLNYECLLDPSPEGAEFYERLAGVEFIDGQTRKAILPLPKGHLSSDWGFERSWLEQLDGPEISVGFDVAVATDGLARVVRNTRLTPLTAYPDGGLSHPTSTSGYDYHLNTAGLIARWSGLVDSLSQPTQFEMTPEGLALQRVTESVAIRYPSMEEVPIGPRSLEQIGQA